MVGASAFAAPSTADGAGLVGTVAIETHGCKLNQADSEALARRFARRVPFVGPNGRRYRQQVISKRLKGRFRDWCELNMGMKPSPRRSCTCERRRYGP